MKKRLFIIIPYCALVIISQIIFFFYAKGQINSSDEPFTQAMMSLIWLIISAATLLVECEFLFNIIFFTSRKNFSKGNISAFRIAFNLLCLIVSSLIVLTGIASILNRYSYLTLTAILIVFYLLLRVIYFLVSMLQIIKKKQN